MAVMSRTQSNAIHKLAKDAGLDPADFSLATTEQHYRGEVDVFTHRPTGSHLDISISDEKLWVSWWPKFTNEDTTHFARSWDEAIHVALAWLRAVKQDHDAPDLWAEARKERQLSDAAGAVGEDNTPFTADEVKALEQKLPEVEAYIEARQPLDAEQKQHLRTRFQYLLGAAKRGLGRIDWVNIFIGQMFQMATDGLVHSSTFGAVMSRAWTLLGGIVKAGIKCIGG